MTIYSIITEAIRVQELEARPAKVKGQFVTVHIRSLSGKPAEVVITRSNPGPVILSERILGLDEQL